MKTTIQTKILATLIATAALTACGGGGDDFTITHAPTLAASKMDHTAGQANFNAQVLSIINGYRATGVN